MKVAEVFRQVKALLESDIPGSFQFICVAIQVVGNHCTREDPKLYRELVDVCEQARSIVVKRISPHYTLERWVRFELGIKDAKQSDMLAFRIRWLDALIEEFDK